MNIWKRRRRRRRGQGGPNASPQQGAGPQGSGPDGTGAPGSAQQGSSSQGQTFPGQSGPGASPSGQGSGQHRQQGQPSRDARPPRPPALPLDIDGNPITTPRIKPWEELTSIDPAPRLTLEYPGCPASCRLIDLFCPIGRGQRGLIVSPPKAGKTTLLKDIATAVLRNHPDVEVVVLLIDERPEEVTDFRRTFTDAKTTALAQEMLRRGEDAFRHESPNTPAPAPAPAPRPRCRVVGSSNDHPVERHIETAIKTLEACKRMVEHGRHVVVLLDSLTRLGRAFNQSRKHAGSGRTMTGGLDSKALEVPRQIFGAARNTEEAGSLTIIASCLVDTGSAADQVIFEEFKGSGNMELILDRKIAERRLFPAINLAESGTRKEDKLMTETELKTVTALRRRLMAMQGPQQVEQLLAAMKRYPTNGALVGEG